MLCAGNESGQLTLYDLTTLAKRDEFVFESPVALATFVKEGRQLFVLTEDQNVFLLDTSRVPNSGARTAPARRRLSRAFTSIASLLRTSRR